MLIQINDKYSWQSFPITDELKTIELTQEQLNLIGVTHKFALPLRTKTIMVKEQVFDEGLQNYKEIDVEKIVSDNSIEPMTQNEIDEIKAAQSTAAAERQKAERKSFLKAQLQLLSEDLTQDAAGQLIPNLADKKQQFIEYHNELRTLEGKQPRGLK